MKTIGEVLFVMIVGILVAAAFALPIWWLWNDVMPELFGFKKLSFGQALELAILIRLLIPTATSKSE